MVASIESQQQRPVRDKKVPSKFMDSADSISDVYSAKQLSSKHFEKCFKKSAMALQVYTCKTIDDFGTKSMQVLYRFCKTTHGKYQSRNPSLVRYTSSCKICKFL